MPVLQKLILAFLALALLPIILIGSLMYVSTSQTLTAQVHRQLDSVATIQATRLATSMGLNQERLRALTGRPEIQSSLNRLGSPGANSDLSALSQYLAAAKASSITVKEALLASPSGVVLASTLPDSVGQNLSAQPFFAPGLKQSDTTNFLFTEAGGQPGINLVGPIIVGGKVVGEAVIKIDLTLLFTLVQDHSGLGDSGEVALIKQDAAGDGLYLTPLRFDAAAALKRTSPHTDAHSPFTLAKKATASETLDQATDYRGHQVVAAVRPIASTNWRLMAKIDRSEAYAGLDQLFTTLLILVLVTLVVTVFAALFVARSTIDPVLTLAAAAERMSKGDLSQRVTVTSKDEFGNLALAFNNMASGLEKIDQTKSEFVALMSHQLRTPTTAVKGFIAMLIDGYAGKLNPKQAKLLHGAFEENERQVRIINDILLVAAANTDQLSVIKAPTDLNQVVADVISSQAAVLREWGQKVTFTKPKEAVLLALDPDKIRMVIENLISNAMKYSPEHTQIRVSIRHTARQLVLQVSDQGFGIAPADTHKLFQKFSRLDNPNRTQAQGSGLGLYLVKKIIELHQGTVSLKSEVGQGTTVTIRLPLGDAVAPAPARAPRLVAFDWAS